MARKKQATVPPSPGLGIIDMIDSNCMTRKSVYSPRYVRFDARIYQKTQVRTALFTPNEMAVMPKQYSPYITKLPVGVLIPWNTAGFAGYLVVLVYTPPIRERNGEGDENSSTSTEPIKILYRISSRKYMAAHYRTRYLPGATLDMVGLQLDPIAIRDVIYQ